MIEQTREAAATPTRQEIEDFLFDEAALLDAWQLDDWLALFTNDARYVMPSTDRPDGDPRTNFVFIDDDIHRLRGRVARLKSRHAHREYPWSRTRRLIANVRITDTTDDEIGVTASFVVYRLRMGKAAPYIGHYEYRLRQTPDGLKIRYRRAVLDQEVLREHGAVSIIL